MNELHLLQNGRFAGFTSTFNKVSVKTPGNHSGRIPTKKEHLDLITLQHLVFLQLVVDLLISGLSLLLFRTHTTTHCCDFGLLILPGSEEDRSVRMACCLCDNALTEFTDL